MKNILLVSHYTNTPGVMDKLSLYLKRCNYLLSFILNPLYPKSSLKSILKLEKKEVKYKIFWPVQFFLEGIVSVIKYQFNFEKQRFDIAICFDPLSFTNTFIFKRFLNIKKIIYFNLDFSTRRFRNKLLNYIYLELNKFSYKECDYFFYLTENFIKSVDPPKKYVNKAFLLKHTISLANINQKSKKKFNSIVYAGNLSGTIDFTILIKALELLREEGINFTLDIYGSGDRKEYFKKLISNSSIKNQIIFMGVVDNKTLTEKILPKYLIGVAPYITDKRLRYLDHTFHGTDLTTKLVEYIGTGLPIVTTKLYGAFNIIEKNKFGFVVKTANDWYYAIKRLLLDKKLYDQYRINALKYARDYDEEKVLTPVFNKTLS